MNYSDIHSFPFSKNTYTLQSVHTQFFLLLCFYYQKWHRTQTHTHTQYNNDSSLRHAAIYIVLSIHAVAYSQIWAMHNVNDRKKNCWWTDLCAAVFLPFRVTLIPGGKERLRSCGFYNLRTFGGKSEVCPHIWTSLSRITWLKKCNLLWTNPKLQQLVRVYCILWH